MHLLFIYGPPAVGKLTVAKIVAAETGLPLVDNHSLMNPLAHVLGWDHPERVRLGHIFRMELFRSAARANKSLITTFGGGGETFDDFIQKMKTIVTEEGGRVVFVQLMASPEVLISRVGHASRTAHLKMTTPEMLQKRITETPDVLTRALVEPHLEIDTSQHTPEEIAKMIINDLNKKTDSLAEKIRDV